MASLKMDEDDYLGDIGCLCPTLIQACEKILYKNFRLIGILNVRPSIEEAQSWGQDMKNLLQSPYGAALFRAFLQQEYAEENLDFIVKVDEYRNTESSPKGRQRLAWRLYSNYIAIGSPNEINLDVLSRRVTDLAMITPHLSTFDAAQRRIFSLLQNDAYKRFLRWEVYTNLLVAPNSLSRSRGEHNGTQCSSLSSSGSRNCGEEKELPLHGGSKPSKETDLNRSLNDFKMDILFKD
ncbi:regulator of G-protein signaling 8 [Lepeophtheirus salmonis]|uniref:regulator of G-protein signaling 8 n=1 Tax=Lepeophtheirus salmonis TaxID=72036 RepID=UPI003AF35F93